MTDTTKAVALSAQSTVATDLVSLTLAAAVGLGLLFAAGFAHSAVMHDAAHDQRHALAFPCH